MTEYYELFDKARPKKTGGKWNNRLLLKAVQMKYGYNIPISKKRFDYIFKTNNIRGIESRFIDVAHNKKLKELT